MGVLPWPAKPYEKVALTICGWKEEQEYAVPPSQALAVEVEVRTALLALQAWTGPVVPGGRLLIQPQAGLQLWGRGQNG